MADVARTRTVAADVDEVWAGLADFGAIARWAASVDHSCLMSDQTEGEGTVRRIQTGRTTLVERVTEWVPPSRLIYTIEGLPPVLGSVVNRWTIEPADGGARVSLSTRIEAGPRPPQRLVARAVGRRLASAADELLTGLEGAVEGRRELAS
ncbi:MAG: SRPBCC family protein [Acidimicrobiia bacterium]|nr:SRPBCC family protein [Acidimicrobiia bacterium]